MKKKLLCMLLAAAMIFGLTACGDKNEGNKGSAKELVIGGIGPLSGPYANYGLSAKNGATIAVQEINKAGGILGRQITLRYEDSQGDPESAVAAYGKLMDDKMEVSLGTVLSGEMASVCAAAKSDDIMLITPSGSADKAIESNDKAFRICFYDSYQGAAAAQYVKDRSIATEVGVLYQSDNDYSVGLYEAFKAKAGEIGITIKETQTFTSSTSTDFTTQADALAASGCKLIFIPFYAEEASTFLTQARGKFAAGTYFFGADGLDGILGKVAQDTSIADNVLMLTPFAADSSDAKVKSFVKAYEEQFKETPDQFAADGYDAVYAIKAAAEKAGSTSGKAMAKAMTEIEVDGITGKMTWDESGNTSKAASAILYYNGQGTLFSK